MNKIGIALRLVLLCFAQFSLAQTTVYTWVDENGVLHFSDSPVNNKADRLELPDHSQPAPAPQFQSSNPVDKPVAKKPKPAPKKQVKEKPLAKLAIEFNSPTHDQTIRNNQGNFTVSAKLNRELAIDEQLQLLLDGNKHGAPTTFTEWALKNVYRGSHVLQIQALKDGKVIASSKLITVHLHRQSIK